MFVTQDHAPPWSAARGCLKICCILIYMWDSAKSLVTCSAWCSGEIEYEALSATVADRAEQAPESPHSISLASCVLDDDFVWACRGRVDKRATEGNAGGAQHEVEAGMQKSHDSPTLH